MSWNISLFLLSMKRLCYEKREHGRTLRAQVSSFSLSYLFAFIHWFSLTAPCSETKVFHTNRNIRLLKVTKLWFENAYNNIPVEFFTTVNRVSRRIFYLILALKLKNIRTLSYKCDAISCLLTSTLANSWT